MTVLSPAIASKWADDRRAQAPRAVEIAQEVCTPDERFNVLGRLSRSLDPGGTLVCVDKEVPRIAVADAPAAAEAWFQKARQRLQAEGLTSALPQALYDRLLHEA